MCCCTFLKSGLEISLGYENVLIFAPAVAAFITRGGYSFVVSELEVASVGSGINDFGILAEGLLERLSQSSFQLSQFSQFSNQIPSFPYTEDI